MSSLIKFTLRLWIFGILLDLATSVYGVGFEKAEEANYAPSKVLAFLAPTGPVLSSLLAFSTLSALVWFMVRLVLTNKPSPKIVNLFIFVGSLKLTAAFYNMWVLFA